MERPDILQRGFTFKPSLISITQRISYSKKDSDVIAKMKGTFVERPKKKRHDDEEKSEKKKKKGRGDR